MICDTLTSWKSLKMILPATFGVAFAWIEKYKDDPPADATVPLDNGLRVIVQSYHPKNLEDPKFENHHKFIDVQYVVSGTETIFWTKSKDLAITAPYSSEKDVEFCTMKDPAANSTSLLLEAGMFAIFWPGDWHLPCIDPVVAHPSCIVKSGKVKKFVVKVPA
ncbi:MAG: YhcH/YjgK/YiaL family protein [Candidatus Sigynarchaeota archaeon]